MTTKAKKVTAEVRVSAFFTADDVTRREALASALAWVVQSGNTKSLHEAVDYLYRKTARAKNGKYAVDVHVWNEMINDAYASDGCYDDACVVRIIANRAKAADCRKDSIDATAAAVRTWLNAMYKAESDARKAAKAELEAAKAALEESAKAAAELAALEAEEARIIAARHANSIEGFCVEVQPASAPMATLTHEGSAPVKAKAQRAPRKPAASGEKRASRAKKSA